MDTERKLLQEFADLKKRSEQAELIAKDLKNQLAVKEQIIVSMLIQKEAEATAKYEGLGFARLRKPEIKTAQYPKQHEEDFFNFVRGLGQGEIIKPTIHSATLRSFIKTCLEEGEDLPEYLYYEQIRKLTLYKR